VLDTLISVNNPPSSRRKFGSSFIVPMTVRLAPVRGDAGESVSTVGRDFGRLAAALAAAVRRRVPAAPLLPLADAERADSALTYADLPVAELAESVSKATPASPAE
jgi:hypothetical protein